MDGGYSEGWYLHPNHDLIRVSQRGGSWVYQCFSKNGAKALSKERELDSWTWALSEPTENFGPRD